MAVKEKILDALEKYTYKLRGVVVSKSDVIDGVTSSLTNAPLSANQGRILQGQIDNLQSGITTAGINYTDVSIGTVSVGTSHWAQINVGIPVGVKIVSAQAITWSAPTGPFSIQIYNDNNAYLIADNGFSVSNLVVRYYYTVSTNATVEEADLVAIPAFAGSSYSNYGGCYYYKQGSRVTVHLGLQGLTANTIYKSKQAASPYYLPEAVRPRYEVVDHGHGGGVTYDAVISVEPDGDIQVMSKYSYANVTVSYDVLTEPAS